MMVMRLSSALVALVLAAPAAAIELADPPEFVEGRSATIRLVDAGTAASGLAVRATYRQNAHEALVSEQELGVTATDGTLEWVPAQAGVVVLSWEGGSQAVSVLHDGTPLLGVLIAILAGIVLLGGSVLFFVRMVTEKGAETLEEAADEGMPPST